MLRWGMLGAGVIAPSFVRDFSYMKNAELVGVAASDPVRLKRFQSEHQIPQAMSYDELYQHPDIDVVYISTTHNFHFQQSMKCLQAGKAVLCEKPLTVNLHECSELIDFSRTTEVFLMEGMWTWFLPVIQKVKEWIEEGRIGKIKSIQAEFAYPMKKDQEGRMYNPKLAGGSLLDLGIYPIALSQYLMRNAPFKILASGKLAKTGVDEQVAIIFQYEDSISILFSSIVTRMTNMARIFCEKGIIEIPDFWRAYKARMYDLEYQQTDEIIDDRKSHGFIYEMQHANDLILAGKTESPVMTLETSLFFQKSLSEIRNQIGLIFPDE